MIGARAQLEDAFAIDSRQPGFAKMLLDLLRCVFEGAHNREKDSVLTLRLCAMRSNTFTITRQPRLVSSIPEIRFWFAERL